MRVELISHTVPTQNLIERGIKTAEDLIVYAARVSAPTNQLKTETGPRLIRYCMKQGHWSILQQADFAVEVETSRAIAAQILRHDFDVQEFSQRYADPAALVNADGSMFEVYEARRQDSKDRQNSLDDLSEADKEWFLGAQEINNMGSQALYEESLRRGIAKECARFLLPLSVRTRMYLKYNVRGWVHYLQARTHSSAQKEHRDIAVPIRDDIFRPLFPVVYEAVWGEQ
jgi:thymidylate synthase (FAD)